MLLVGNFHLKRVVTLTDKTTKKNRRLFFGHQKIQERSSSKALIFQGRCLLKVNLGGPEEFILGASTTGKNG